MTGLPCDPVQEKDALYGVIDTLHRQWGKAGMAQAYTTLQVGVAPAAQVLSVLESHQDKRGIAFKIHLLGLACIVMVARRELKCAQRLLNTAEKKDCLSSSQ
ncbi:MAG TPA: hypothetical protein VKK81_15725 [Candidatus Binatia bacterium]|nr:hypothetical protein [Candidatus Binatia bacterium]